MKFPPAIYNWLRGFLMRHGVARTVIAFTFLSIIVSVLVTILVANLFSDGPGVIGLAIAVAVPAIVGPLFTYLQLSLLHELERTREEVRALAITDGLTRAFNRRHFIGLAGRELDRARRHALPLSIILFDADDFKKINDTYGHLCGDAALQQISASCQTVVRRHDVFARYGGEEFILLLPGTGAADAHIVAERIRQLVAETGIECTGRSIRVTISIGVTTLQGEKATLDELLARTDRALYEAKAAGKNCVRVVQNQATEPSPQGDKRPRTDE
jgi:diguanylate cyclase (GGDEF)-like protein